MRRIALLSLFLLITSIPFITAANDPGHDSLYVLLLGNSDVIGSINVTQNVNATFLKISNKLFGDYLDVVANGTVLGTPSTPRIMGASSSLYIDSTGNLYINTKGGTSNLIQVGDVATNGVTLNVSGSIQQQGVAVCLSNGTNCPGSLGSANITGSGTTGYLSRWASSSNLGNSVIYDDGTRVGIGTASPVGMLNVVGAINITSGNITVDQDSGVCFNPTCTSRIYYNGSATVIEGQ